MVRGAPQLIDSHHRVRRRFVTTTPTNDTDLNRKIIRAAFEAWQAGTAPIADVFADDMVWRIEGHSFAAKQYDNKRQFMDEVLAPFGTASRRENGSARPTSALSTRTPTP